MNTFKNLALFLIFNLVGAFTAPSLYAIALTQKLVDIQESGLTQGILGYDILIIQLNWLACALFSFSVFFLKGTWKKIFLLAPIIIPFILTVITLIKY